MLSYKIILENALKLRPGDRVHLVEEIMMSFEKPNSDINKIWEEEAIKRYRAYKEKHLKVKDLDEVMQRY